MRLHRRFNEEINTQLNIVPGLMGVILTMSMVFITALAVTRERERGTMESLLATPVSPRRSWGQGGSLHNGRLRADSARPAGARFVFAVPIEGSLTLLVLLSFFFIAANLCVGVTFSTLARNQLQAVQGAIFFFLPSLLLSGFMFPFKGMPAWAQFVGNLLPLTHYLAIVRGILLKGCVYAEIAWHFYAILAFLAVAAFLGVLRYRQSLD
jgi:ABC-2 type transport system permease protein